MNRKYEDKNNQNESDSDNELVYISPHSETKKGENGGNALINVTFSLFQSAIALT